MKAQQDNVELRIDAVKEKVGAEYQNRLHAQFMQGLATGSAMASQCTMQVPEVQPFSFGSVPNTCSTSRSAGLGSTFPSTQGSDV
eukprot:362746-Pleurochrysis_carterae.AAC.3